MPSRLPSDIPPGTLFLCLIHGLRTCQGHLHNKVFWLELTLCCVSSTPHDISESCPPCQRIALSRSACWCASEPGVISLRGLSLQARTAVSSWLLPVHCPHFVWIDACQKDTHRQSYSAQEGNIYSQCLRCSSDSLQWRLSIRCCLCWTAQCSSVCCHRWSHKLLLFGCVEEPVQSKINKHVFKGGIMACASIDWDS